MRWEGRGGGTSLTGPRLLALCMLVQAEAVSETERGEAQHPICDSLVRRPQSRRDAGRQRQKVCVCVCAVD